MQEIKCPNCGEVFQVDESGYSKIVQQVRDSEFENELKSREKDLEEKKENELKFFKLQQEKEREKLLSQKEKELSEKDRMLEALKARLENTENEKKFSVADAVREQEKSLNEKNVEIVQLKSKLDMSEKENSLKEKVLKEKYEEKIKLRDDEIERLKDFKMRQSTKMVGESLEQHCLSEFNKIRMTAFPTAYFEKDNDAHTGSKGDFIFREASADGTEFISIMFEMKNEMESTDSRAKHKNEDFFKELDKDRREKNCEYAVLVSLLEIDNEFYNNGIVDVSYKYEKMYVIRPQFFIPMITLLRNAALNSLQYKKELKLVKEQQLDILNFEENMNAFKAGFARNYELASRRFNEAIEEIDKTIIHLQKVKEALTLSEKNLRIANDKADELSIKKLTRNAPSVREMFDELQNK